VDELPRAEHTLPGPLTHFDERGRARMVDVGEKDNTIREATATARITMQPATLQLIVEKQMAKGDVLGVAQLAGIQAAKRTWELIPLCHNISLTGVDVHLDPIANLPGIAITARVRTIGKTGAEMEALTAATVAALTIYDMCKAVDRGMIVRDVRLERKSGGKSGVWEASTP